MSNAQPPVPESFLRDAVRKIVEALHPQKIILFGSQAYGEPGRGGPLRPPEGREGTEPLPYDNRWTDRAADSLLPCEK